jgi:hypothetical protein
MTRSTNSWETADDRPRISRIFANQFFGLFWGEPAVSGMLQCLAYSSLGANLPFDKLRANGQAFSFALSLSKGSFPPI